MPLVSRHPALPTVLREHAFEFVQLRLQRRGLVRAPHVGLSLLGRHDQRIAAHLDGLVTAGPAGVAALGEQATTDGPNDVGAVFAAAALALIRRDIDGWLAALQLLQTLPPSHEDATRSASWRGLLSALGWVSANDLRGVVQPLLAAPQPLPLALGLACCRLHRVDAGESLAAALTHTHAAVRVQALRTAGALKRSDLLPAVLDLLSDGDAGVALHAAHAACLLGEHRASLPVLMAAAQSGSHASPAALDLAFAALAPAAASEWTRQISADAAGTPADRPLQRLRLRAIGLLGDPRFVPWLIEQMADPALARLAGEALVWITGVDMTTAGLEWLDSRPADDADDDEDAAIELDEDDSLPWPDAARVQAWWQRHGDALRSAAIATGGRLLAGRPRDGATAAYLLVHGTQRLRAHAALLLAVLQPQTTLMPVAAPAWRQQRWLSAN